MLFKKENKKKRKYIRNLIIHNVIFLILVLGNFPAYKLHQIRKCQASLLSVDFYPYVLIYYYLLL